MTAMQPPMNPRIEARIREWRSYLLRRQSIHAVDIEELEDHLRSEMSELGFAGLTEDESFFVAIGRLGGINDLSREFARERSSRLWKQLVVAGGSVREHSREWHFEMVVMFGLAVAAALSFKVPAVFGVDPFGGTGPAAHDTDTSFYLRNGSLLVLPFLLVQVAWHRRLSRLTVARLSLPFAVVAVLINVYPLRAGGDTESLVAIGVPVFLWLVTGVAFVDGDWRGSAPRMEFVRFTGEWAIYYTLVALGGGILAALTVGVFESIGITAEVLVSSWVLPCGAAGAVVVVAWLVEAKQSVIENMAPVLTAVFSPLFALMLLSAITGMAVTGNAVHADRDVLILFDGLLVVVLGLVLYSTSARDSGAGPGLLDAVQLVLVISALVIDLVALGAMASRISDFGWTPNRTAGLALNLVLLGNLSSTAWLLGGFLTGRRGFAALERWQTGYIPVYAFWCVAVVAVFPPLFGFE